MIRRFLRRLPALTRDSWHRWAVAWGNVVIVMVGSNYVDKPLWTLVCMVWAILVTVTICPLLSDEEDEE